MTEAAPVVVLAAGRGARMMPATASRHKLLFDVDGQPLLERVLLRVAEAGADRVVIVTGYLGEQIAHLVDARLRSAMRDVELTLVHDENPTGTLESLFCARRLLRDDPFVTMEGSILLSPDVIRRFVWPEAPTPMIGVTTSLHLATAHSRAAVAADDVVVAMRRAYEDPPAPPTDGRLGRFLGIARLDAMIFDYRSAGRDIALGLRRLIGEGRVTVRATWDDGEFRHFATPAEFGPEVPPSPSDRTAGRATRPATGRFPGPRWTRSSAEDPPQARPPDPTRGALAHV